MRTSGSEEDSKAIASQLTTISKLRLRERIGSLAPSDVAAVERAIRVELAR
jgi:mRNA-degrading endonuclease toxin of MazEF toxin-antitoxin module